MEGYYNVRPFLYQRQICFSCFACTEPKRLEDEARYTEPEAGLPALKLTDRGEKRWCKGCWRVVSLYVNARLV